MKQRLEEFLEVMVAFLVKLLIYISQLLLELCFKILVCYILVCVIVELLAEETILLENSNVVRCNISHHSNTPQLVALWVLVAKIFITLWNDSWQDHLFLMLS
jgi:hypothetical protein